MCLSSVLDTECQVGAGVRPGALGYLRASDKGQSRGLGDGHSGEMQNVGGSLLHMLVWLINLPGLDNDMENSTDP